MTKEENDALQEALQRLPDAVRCYWVDEVNRLVRIVITYEGIRPKRRINLTTEKYEFVPEVLALCQEARCTDPIIVEREPHRARPPSPYTLDQWLRDFKNQGSACFLRDSHTIANPQEDNRFATISIEAVDWINARWKDYTSPSFLYGDLRKEANIKGWIIPSESWLYRHWKNMPGFVRDIHLKGMDYYESKHAPYVPRDYSDLAALQVLCGDYSERDVSVLFPRKVLARPWAAIWLDLRTGLIYGRHVGRYPSSQGAALAYAYGVTRYGAQPLSRPEEDNYSYVYTDRGRTYLAHDWDGKVISVHEQVMRLDGGMELLLVERKVGLLDDLQLKHLIARRRNAKEKPVERVFKDMSFWEQNTFPEYCGRDAKSRPETWNILYAQHREFLKGARENSPFRTVEEYVEKLDEFIERHNNSEHMRVTLGGKKVIPEKEYKKLYTVKYKIEPKKLALLLYRKVKRVLYKNGVKCFRPDWFYYNQAMSKFKGQEIEVEVCYTDDDYSHVWVILPDKEMVRANLIKPTSLLNPNKETLKEVDKARRYERDTARDFELIQLSKVRGESTEDRVMRQLSPAESTATEKTDTQQTEVYQLTRFDHYKTLTPSPSPEVDVSEVAEINADNTIFSKLEFNL